VPPTRRRPVPPPPSPGRRPKVAGLRRPSGEQETGEPKVAEPETVHSTGVDSTGADEERVAQEGQGRPVAGTAVIGADEPAVDEIATDETPAEKGVAADPVTEGEAETSRPRGRKRRDVEPVSVYAVAGEDKATPFRTGPYWAVPVALLVVAALLSGLGFWFYTQAHPAGGTAAANQALVDSAKTSEASGQVQSAVEKAFSYNFSDIAATENAAKDMLVGKAKCQYDVVFEPVRKLAPEQKLVVTTKAVSSGVTVLSDSRATVLVFVDQVTTRTTDNQTGGGYGMLRVSAERLDGKWKLTDLFMFGQTSDQEQQMAKCKDAK
jgi:Mce-associated membrane protein